MILCFTHILTFLLYEFFKYACLLSNALPHFNSFWITNGPLQKGNFEVADFPSFVIRFATSLTPLANCSSFSNVISMLCMVVCA